MRECGIYSITNILNNKKYIGQSVNILKRFEQHRCSLRKNNHSNRHLQNSWNKYGEPNFKFEVIELCEVDKLNNLEEKYMDRYDALNAKVGYNINPVMYGNNRYTYRTYGCYEDSYFMILHDIMENALPISKIARIHNVSSRLVNDIESGSFKRTDCIDSVEDDIHIRKQHLYKAIIENKLDYKDINIDFVDNLDRVGFNPNIFWEKYDKVKSVEATIFSDLEPTLDEADYSMLEERNDTYNDGMDDWDKRAINEYYDELREEYSEFASDN